MKLRLLHLALLMSFLCCYLEWGKGRWAFIAEVDYEVVVIKHQRTNFLHPVILLGLLSQVIFLYGAVAKRTARWLTIVGIILAGLIVLLCFLVGLLSTNFKIILSTLPYFFFCIVFFRSASQLYSTKTEH